MKCKNCVRHVHVNDDGERTIGTPNWCFYLSDSPCEENERECPAFKPLTNADRIRAMTDEELAEFIAQQRYCTINPIADKFGVDTTQMFIKTQEIMLKWLKGEGET